MKFVRNVWKTTIKNDTNFAPVKIVWSFLTIFFHTFCQKSSNFVRFYKTSYQTIGNTAKLPLCLEENLGYGEKISSDIVTQKEIWDTRLSLQTTMWIFIRYHQIERDFGMQGQHYSHESGFSSDIYSQSLVWLSEDRFHHIWSDNSLILTFLQTNKLGQIHFCSNCLYILDWIIVQFTI
jgi:hypothetical protein